jgi:hypothetical protein
MTSSNTILILLWRNNLVFTVCVIILLVTDSHQQNFTKQTDSFEMLTHFREAKIAATQPR